jgi:hypothetical protein
VTVSIFNSKEMGILPNCKSKFGFLPENHNSSVLLTLFIYLDKSTGNPTIDEAFKDKDIKYGNSNNTHKPRYKNRNTYGSPSGSASFSTLVRNSDIKTTVIFYVYNNKVIPLVVPKCKRYKS